MGYAAEKKKYDTAMQKAADSQIKCQSFEDVGAEVVYNKFELHDTRILVGVLADLLMKKGLITKKELETEISAAYTEELKALKS